MIPGHTRVLEEHIAVRTATHPDDLLSTSKAKRDPSVGHYDMDAIAISIIIMLIMFAIFFVLAI